MLRKCPAAEKSDQRAWPGLLHGFFFWGFVLLFIGTTLIVIQADFTDLLFDVKFLKGTFYKLFSITLDLAAWSASPCWRGFLVRRYFFPGPKGLPTKPDDAIMHGLLLAILITGFIIEGSRMAVTELGTPLAPWSPVGLLFAKAPRRHGQGRAACPAQGDLVVPSAAGDGLFHHHPAHQVPAYPDHQQQLFLCRSRRQRQTRQSRSGERGGRDLRRQQHQAHDLEGHLRCRRLHPLQALPGSLSGLEYRQAAVAHEGGQPDRRGGLQQPGSQSHRRRHPGCPVGLHYLPGLSGDLPRGDRACRQDHRDAPVPRPHGRRVSGR